MGEVVKGGLVRRPPVHLPAEPQLGQHAAYLLDRHAAGMLLQAAYPLRVHVDVYVHEMSCVLQTTRLYNFQPNLIETSSRPSTHMSTFTLQRLYILAVEAFENMLAGECTRLHLF